MRSLTTLAVLVACVALAPRAAAQSVWFADTGSCPVSDFSSAQDAIDAAGDGDVVVIRGSAGAQPLVVDGKSLTLAADGAQVLGSSLGGLVVRDLAANQRVTVRGFTLAPTVEVRDCAGSVWLEDCFVPADSSAASNPSLLVTDSDAVVLVRCDVEGSAGPTAGADALELDGGRVYAWGSRFAGSAPLPVAAPGRDGGHGVHVLGSGFVLLDDCLASGGDGWAGTTCGPGGDGGDGVRLQNVGGVAWTLDSALSGGLGGQTGSCPAGQDGLPVGGNGAGNLTALAGASRALTAPALAAEGQTIDLALDVLPTDQPFLLLALDVAPLNSSAFDGVLVPQLPGLLLALPPGASSVPVTLPDGLAPVGTAVPLVLQPLVLQGGDKRAGAPSWLTVLDAGLADVLECTVTLWVDDDAANDPAPGDPSVGDPAEDGSAEHPFDSIQEALDAAVDGVEVVIRDGTYDTWPNDRLLLGDKSITVRSENGPEACTLVGLQYGFLLGETPAGSEVRGLTITDATFAAAADPSGLGAALTRFVDCRITGNTHGIRHDGNNSAMVFEDCLIADNLLVPVRVLDGSLTLIRCDVRDNGSFAVQQGAVHVDETAAIVMRDCMVVRNSNAAGAAVYSYGRVTATGCTFALNPSSSIGPEIHLRQVMADATFSHCIFWGIDKPILVRPGAQVAVEYSFLALGTDGVELHGSGSATFGPGIVDGLPAFKDPAADDFHLGPSSPCIDAGDPAFVALPGQTDIDGQPRVMGAAVDLGADERP